MRTARRIIPIPPAEWLMATLGAYCLLAMEKESEKAPFSGEIVFDRLLLEGTRMIPHRLAEAGDL